MTSLGSRRNNAAALAAYADAAFGARRYLLVNLAPEERSGYDAEMFGGQVAKFPPVVSESEDDGGGGGGGASEDGLPSVAEAFRVVYALHFWLSWSPEHVVIVHDLSGCTRSAFMVACYLAWAHKGAWTAQGAYNFFEARRGAHFRLPSSWWETLCAFQTIVRAPHAVLPRKLQLLKVVASMRGNVELLAEPPLVSILQEGELVWDSAAAAGGGGEDGNGGGCAAFVFDEGELKCDVNRFVAGDVTVLITADVISRRAMRLFPISRFRHTQMQRITFIKLLLHLLH